jgi:hypothetical protein
MKGKDFAIWLRNMHYYVDQKHFSVKYKFFLWTLMVFFEFASIIFAKSLIKLTVHFSITHQQWGHNQVGVLDGLNTQFLAIFWWTSPSNSHWFCCHMQMSLHISTVGGPKLLTGGKNKAIWTISKVNTTENLTIEIKIKPN